VPFLHDKPLVCGRMLEARGGVCVYLRLLFMVAFESLDPYHREQKYRDHRPT
jgi:hypothetical protein